MVATILQHALNYTVNCVISGSVLALSVIFLFVYKISRESLNGFAPNLQRIRVKSLDRTNLKVKVNFGGLRAVYVW